MSDTTAAPLTAAPTTPTRSSSHNSPPHDQPAATNREPVALATTKRKFHRLLENITGNTPRTKPAAKDPHETAAKRIRLEARGRLTSSSAKASIVAGSGSLQTEILAGRLATAINAERKPSESISKEPNYLPWNYDQFSRRLKTFADIRLWTPKPDRMNEVQWAKRGWTCVAWNTVACKGGCEQRVVISLRPAAKDDNGQEIEETEDFSVDILDELVDRYVELIQTGHDESCLWKDAGCKDDIFRLPIAKTTIWQSQLRERYLSLHAILDHLPPLSRLSLPFDISKVAAQLLPAIIQPHPTDATPSTEEPSVQLPTISSPSQSTTTTPPPIDERALAFALLGWSGSPDPALATCSTCFRRLGLWLYIDSPATNQTEPQDPAALPEQSLLPTLDLADNHRDYCPWINPVSQHMPGSFAGLSASQVLLRLIANHAVHPSSSTTSLVSHLDRPSTASTVRVVGEQVGNEAETVSIGGWSHGDGEEGGEGDKGSPRREKGQVEREDKARFARLKELTRLLGLRKGKGKKV